MKICLVADMLEEGWPSMDLFPEMLLRYLPEIDHSLKVDLFRLPLQRRLSCAVRAPAGYAADRLVARHFDYPRALRNHDRYADIYHVLDHSYAVSVHSLPQAHTVVTCHDLDAFEILFSDRHSSRRRILARLAKITLSGMQKAARVICDSKSIAAELVTRKLVRAELIVVIPPGIHPACTSNVDPVADAFIDSLIGPRGDPELLHVGSAIPRKRLDVVVESFVNAKKKWPNLKLLRLGGDFTPDQRSLVERLGISDAITVLPTLTRPQVAAVYRRAALLVLPSDREGFGLPVIESLACGTPVLARDIDVLREVGGDAVTYVRGDSSQIWSDAIAELLTERRETPGRWRERVALGIAWSSRFSWREYSRELLHLYRTMLE